MNRSNIEKTREDTIVSVMEIHKFFQGVHVLKGVDLDVRPGQLVSIIGRSGCGKTTLLRCLNCLEIPDSGFMRINGTELDIRKAHKAAQNSTNQDKGNGISKDDHIKGNKNEYFRQKAALVRTSVGMLFQGLNLFPHITVLENVTIAPLIVKKVQKEQAESEALQILEKVGMEKYVNRYPGQLSGGQAQRVAIARALAMNPKVMLYDEPTAALDPELIEEVLQVMRNLHEEGMTQIVVTHAINFARTASDLVCYMEDGKIVETAPPDEIFNKANDDRTRRYLSILNNKI